MGRMGKCKAMQKCFLFFSVLVFAKTVAAVASVFHLQPTGNGLLPRSDGVGKGTQSLYEFVISHMHEALIWWIKVHSKAQCRGNSTLVTTLYNCIYCIYIYIHQLDQSASSAAMSHACYRSMQRDMLCSLCTAHATNNVLATHRGLPRRFALPDGLTFRTGFD